MTKSRSVTALSEQANDTYDLFDLWKEYERIAMHFNDLIIKLRSQSLGAVAAFATLVAVITKNETAPELRWGFLTGTFALLSVFWIAVWMLDMCYYNRLLAGAVDAILKIESESKLSSTVSEIDLSTRIEARVKSGSVGNNNFRQAFYALVLAALLVSLGISVHYLRGSANSGQAHAADVTHLRKM
jgi:hypothetical protein